MLEFAAAFLELELLLLLELEPDLSPLFLPFSWLLLDDPCSFSFLPSPPRPCIDRGLNPGPKPGILKPGNPSNGFPRPMLASPPNGKNIGGAAEVLAPETDWLVVVDDDVPLVRFPREPEVELVVDVGARLLASMNILLNG